MAPHAFQKCAPMSGMTDYVFRSRFVCYLFDGDTVNRATWGMGATLTCTNSSLIRSVSRENRP